MDNKNSFNEGINVGSGNTAGRDINIHIEDGAQPKEPDAIYEAEPIWRSPVTMAVLSWISFLMSLGGVFSFYKTVEPLINRFVNFKESNPTSNNQLYAFLFFGFFLGVIISFSLRKIAKNQMRYPLIFNYALSGEDKRLNIEKIKTAPCPICKGKMKYYNKPDEWLDEYDENGNFKKRRIIKRKPALECKRNKNHFWYVDPADIEV